MLFKPEMISQILAGNKTMTRRLVKEGEGLLGWVGMNPKEPTTVLSASEKIKWRVGKKYAVCPGRGKPQTWYCKECKLIDSSPPKNKPSVLYLHEDFCGPRHIKKDGSYGRTTWDCGEVIPLFIELVAIRKEKLLDITEEDAKLEGFETRSDFLSKFCLINFKGNYSAMMKANPEVWVLEFKVVK